MPLMKAVATHIRLHRSMCDTSENESFLTSWESQGISKKPAKFLQQNAVKLFSSVAARNACRAGVSRVLCAAYGVSLYCNKKIPERKFKVAVVCESSAADDRACRYRCNVFGKIAASKNFNGAVTAP